MADNRSNIFYNLSYTHHEIEELLRKIAAGNVLLAADYDKLINIIGLDNISTFSGNYNDLKNTPNIPAYTSDLQDDIGFDTKDNVNQKLDAMYDRLVSLINEYENENEGIFANQAALDIQLQNLSWSLREYVEQQINQLPLTNFATKTSLASKSDVGHRHDMHEVNGLNKELDHKSDIDHNHDLRYASAAEFKFLENLNKETEAKIEDWDERVDILTEQLLLVDEKLDTELSDNNLSKKWDTLHDIAHENLSVLNGISDTRVKLWDSIDYLKFKTEKPYITTQTVGGLDKGTDIGGFSVHMLLERILLPDIKPEATVRIDPSKVDYEKGQSAIIKEIVVNITLGSNPIKEVVLFRDGEILESKVPSETEGNATLTFALDHEINTSIAKGYYRIKVTDDKGYSITIDAPAINFHYPCYFGIVAKDTTIDALSESQILAMTKKVEAKGSSKSYSYTVSQQRMVFAYPKEYGELSMISDVNGFNVTSSFEKKIISIATADGSKQEYYVYMNNPSTNTNFKITYKF
jgi:hypothetical protein